MTEISNQSAETAAPRQIIFVSTFAKTFDFETRASRLEYWSFIGICAVLAGLCGWIDISQGWSDLSSLGPLSIAFLIIIWLPGLAVSLRRLHDVDLSGWICLINLIPIMGPLLMIMITTESGTKGPNRFGPDPYATGDEDQTPSDPRENSQM